MTSHSSKITLIGTRMARIGVEFFFQGSAEECEGCKLKNTCMGLEASRRYRVVEIVQETEHVCPLHDTGVKAVRVVKAPLTALMDAKKAFEGSSTVFNPPECEETDCPQYELCHPEGILAGEKCTINRVLADNSEECMQTRKLKMVELVL